MDWTDIKRHYESDYVAKEIIDYSKSRWVALEAPSEGQRIFIRYDKGEPLSIKDRADYDGILQRFSHLKPRTIYATANLYSVLNLQSVKNETSIIRTTPAFDVDGSLEDYKLIMKVADIIVQELDRFKVSKSVYLIWSGRGVHVQINENAFSDDLLKRYGPLRVARSVVEFILARTHEEIKKIAAAAKNSDRELKAENKMDVERVFTVPLSFHRFLDYVCVAFKPNEINDFDIAWADPKNYRHNASWRDCVIGEADELALKALQNHPKAEPNEYPIKRETDVTARKNEGLGRFQVMGLMQAARYYLIKGDIKKAKSFGLNRAIFYAWAKRYGPVKKGGVQKRLGEETTKEEVYGFEKVGNEEAPIDKGSGLFMIGNKVQTPEDYDREIAMRINAFVPYDKAWERTLKYMSRFPKEYLEDQRLFFERVYRPVRDSFLEKVVEEKELDEDQAS
ncbi:MAG: hypothetical protein ACP5FU_00040 [Nitrososphaeria archaeon]